MSRLFLLLAIVAVVYLLIWSFRRNAPGKAVPGPDKAAEDMVRCAHCGVHLPKGESVRAEGRDYCSVEHRDAYLKSGQK